jgi:hypothetical protein
MWGVAAGLVLLAGAPAPAALPDLVPDVFDVRIERDQTVDPGDVVEGCAGGASGRTLLRFSLRTRNVGAGDLVLGDPGCPPCAANPGAPCTNPLYVCAPAHGHPHFAGYADAELVRADDGVAALGRKIGFCVLDSECSTPKYTCSFQGLSAGCADVYPSTLPCQYIDLTGVELAAGSYRLRVTVDPEQRIVEADEANNTIELPLPLDCDTARAVLPGCRPGSFLCYPTSVRGKPEPLPKPVPTRSFLGGMGAVDAAIGRGRHLCRPAAVGDHPRLDATTHLHRHDARPTSRSGATDPTADVRIVTALGESRLDLRRPDTVAVPAATAADTSPVPLAPAAHTVDRFACFPTRVPRTARKSLRPVEVLVADDGLGDPQPLAVKKPRRLCSPVATSDAPMRIAARHLLCHDVGRPRVARARRIGVLDEVGARVVDLGRPDELCLLAERNPPIPAAGALEPCAGPVDVWRFAARAGQTVSVAIDTGAAATAADLCAELACGELQRTGDDEHPCATAPFGCPSLTGVAVADGPCVVTVHTCEAGCLAAGRADYVLRAAVAGEDAAPTLVVDDGPSAP